MLFLPTQDLFGGDAPLAASDSGEVLGCVLAFRPEVWGTCAIPSRVDGMLCDADPNWADFGRFRAMLADFRAHSTDVRRSWPLLRRPRPISTILGTICLDCVDGSRLQFWSVKILAGAMLRSEIANPVLGEILHPPQLGDSGFSHPSVAMLWNPAQLGKKRNIGRTETIP